MTHPETRHALDAVRPRAGTSSRLAWQVTAAVLCVDALWMLAAGWSISWRGAAVTLLAVGGFGAPLLMARYRNDLRISTTARAAALLTLFMAAASTFSYLVVSTGAPLVDAQLAALDHAIGFRWMALHDWLQSHASIRAALAFAYASGLPQLAFVVVFLGFTARADRLDEFMRLFIAATLLTVLISGLLPAAGAWKHFAFTPSPDLATLSHFEPLRDGSLRHIPLEQMQGIISIPSLHTAMAVLLAWAMRGIRVLGPLFALLNLAMVASTPIDGGHYLVDVIAGAALAGALIALERRRARTGRATSVLAPAPPNPRDALHA